MNIKVKNKENIIVRREFLMITRKEILVMSALGIVGFVFLWCVFYYVIKEKMGVVY